MAAQDRAYFDRINTMGFERATKWAIEQIIGTQAQQAQALKECATQLDKMSEIMMQFVHVAENMKNTSEKLSRTLGEHIPGDAPTPGDDRLG